MNLTESQVKFNCKNICQKMGLDSAFQFVTQNNNLKDEWYHNFFHTECMVHNVAEAAKFLNLDDEWLSKPETERGEMSPSRKLVLAALFHDFNHSGGENEDDALNVKESIKGFELFLSITDIKMSENDIQDVKNIIDATIFPEVRPVNNISEQIIRDADSLQVLMPRWYEQCFESLRVEKSRQERTEHNNVAWVDKQVGFLSYLKGNDPRRTSWATTKISQEINERLGFFQEAKRIFQDESPAMKVARGGGIFSNFSMEIGPIVQQHIKKINEKMDHQIMGSILDNLRKKHPAFKEQNTEMSLS